MWDNTRSLSSREDPPWESFPVGKSLSSFSLPQALYTPVEGSVFCSLTLSNPALFLSSMWHLQVKLFSDIPECAFYGPLSSLQSPSILTSGYGIRSTSTAHIHAMYVAHSAVNRENTISLLEFYQHLFCLKRWKLDFILWFGFIQPSNAQLHKFHPQHYAHTKGSWLALVSYCPTPPLNISFNYLINCPICIYCFLVTPILVNKIMLVFLSIPEQPFWEPALVGDAFC